ncbi:hypothetical protein BaRGS_00007573 [Batillaria attramentaria]|uniref:Uncharacterized protein n=1 Tax=Batillaria attramentaria TaxID=370345 RepID=A0ABD0LPE0_9CAEN
MDTELQLSCRWLQTNVSKPTDRLLSGTQNYSSVSGHTYRFCWWTRLQLSCCWIQTTVSGHTDSFCWWTQSYISPAVGFRLLPVDIQIASVGAHRATTLLDTDYCQWTYRQLLLVDTELQLSWIQTTARGHTDSFCWCTQSYNSPGYRLLSVDIQIASVGGHRATTLLDTDYCPWTYRQLLLVHTELQLSWIQTTARGHTDSFCWWRHSYNSPGYRLLPVDIQTASVGAHRATTLLDTDYCPWTYRQLLLVHTELQLSWIQTTARGHTDSFCWCTQSYNSPGYGLLSMDIQIAYVGGHRATTLLDTDYCQWTYR